VFVDWAKVYLKAGSGGNGCVSFRREKYVPRGGPDGGDGGKGGDILIVADRSIATLLDFQYRPHLKAGNGQHGRGKACTGKNGADLLVRVPVGTVVRDKLTGKVIHDFVEDGDRRVIVRGGGGGKGNKRFAGSTNRAPRKAESGMPGEEATAILELKLIAAAGLVGYPNAGKSTILSKITKARSKIASYPFTTLAPVLGTLDTDDYRTIVIADMPGLIDGAHENRGLGHAFLRHIERTRALIIVVDMAAVDGREPVEDYKSLMRELRLHDEGLARKPFVVAANKMDLSPSEENLRLFREKTGVRSDKIYPISAVKGTGLDNLKKGIREILLPQDNGE